MEATRAHLHGDLEVGYGAFNLCDVERFPLVATADPAQAVLTAAHQPMFFSPIS